MIKLTSRNKLIQKVLDKVSNFRRRIIKDNSKLYWFYNRLFLHFFLGIIEYGIWKAIQIFYLRVKLVIKQKFLIDEYLDWIITNEPLPQEIKVQKLASHAFDNRPCISIVTPVYRPPHRVLKLMLDSVLRQTYPNWEHCIVNADPSDIQTQKVLAEYSRKDHRFKVQCLDNNYGISDNTNRAIQMAQGSWIAFLDHDDQLAPFALYEIVDCINKHENVEAIYSDEDKVNPENNQRYSPFFKPEFDLYLLRGSNYLNHFFAVKKAIGDSIGWLDSSFDGSQDYDLVLRLVEQSSCIAHIPKILYHWTAIEGSVSVSESNKNYAVDAAVRALKNHITKLEIDAEVVTTRFPFRLKYHISRHPLVSIIIPNHNNASMLNQLIETIRNKTTYPNFEIIVVENQSDEPEIFDYYRRIQICERNKVIQWNQEFNFSAVCNYGVEHALGEVILFLNNDMEVINGDWIEEMLGLLLQPKVGVVGAKLRYPNDTIQHAGVIVGMFGVAGHSHRHFPHDSAGYYHRLSCVQRYSAVTAACLMVRKEVFREVGGMDPAFKLEFGDVDFCLRILSQGYINLWTPFAELYHFESQTRGSYDTIEKRELNMQEVSLFKERWAEFLKKGDPSYNINLTNRAENFGIRI